MKADVSIWRCADWQIRLDRPLVMGILNVTPDSFSDGGRFDGFEAAVRRAERMREEGVDIIDIGGESTRPGAAPVSAEEEIRRVAPVIREIVRRGKLPVSVDTMKAAVARRALAEGACIVNDVSAATRDPEMVSAVAEASAGLILMHMRGTPETMQHDPTYANVRRDVGEYLRGRVASVMEAGLPPESLAVDPGIGFGKTLEHNLELLAFIDDLSSTKAQCLVVGPSRKRFLQSLTGRGVGQRLAGTLATLVWCAMHGANVLRVHDVQEACDALRVAVELNKTREMKG